MRKYKNEIILEQDSSIDISKKLYFNGNCSLGRFSKYERNLRFKIFVKKIKATYEGFEIFTDNGIIPVGSIYHEYRLFINEKGNNLMNRYAIFIQAIKDTIYYDADIFDYRLIQETICSYEDAIENEEDLTDLRGNTDCYNYFTVEHQYMPCSIEDIYITCKDILKQDNHEIVFELVEEREL